MNIITIAGRIGQDATTREVGDSTVTSFSVADDQKVKGEKVTTWWNCSIWGARGVALEQYLTKGSNVTVAGTASIRSYTKDGEGKFSAECKVSEVALQGGKPQEGGTSSARQAPKVTRRDEPEFDDSDGIPFISNRSQH